MILVDTQIIIWLAVEPERISPKASEAIREARRSDGVAISDKTLWELAMVFAKGRIGDDLSLRDLLEETERAFAVLPVNAAIAERSVQFRKTFPADPADRIIAATAIVYGLTLVTADSQIRKSGELLCLW
jgi:PIN domain nuclease of toxin-antitoxin system